MAASKAQTPPAAGDLDANAVRAAAVFLQGQVLRTPVLRSPTLDELAGTELWLKAECCQHIGAFKARGALHHVGKLDPEVRARGIITYSSGNHAQAVALAAHRHGVKADVMMPVDAPPIKIARVKQLGAAVHFAGTTSDDRKAAAHALADETGAAIVPPFDDPHIITGQGTATLELFEEVAARTGGEKLDALIVPVGGGGVIAGACLMAAEQGVEVISAEPVGCDALAQSLAAGERVAVQPGPTIADGLKPVSVGERNFAIARQHVTRSLTFEDAEIGRALTTLLLHAKVMVEPSGAVGIAAALGGAVKGRRRVGVMLTGGNLSVERLATLIRDYPPTTVR